MNQETLDPTTIAIIVVLLLLVIATISLFVMVRKLIGSFAKLGFLMREDAKKYFDDAAGKIVDTNQSFQEMYKKIVEEGTTQALQDSSTIMQTVISKAHEEASQAILKAQTDAGNIITTAQKDAEEQKQRILNEAVEAIRWTVNEFAKESFTQDQHEKMIEKLLQEYIHEQQ